MEREAAKQGLAPLIGRLGHVPEDAPVLGLSVATQPHEVARRSTEGERETNERPHA
jgi:hypothetical protein